MRFGERHTTSSSSLNIFFSLSFCQRRKNIQHKFLSERRTCTTPGPPRSLSSEKHVPCPRRKRKPRSRQPEELWVGLTAAKVTSEDGFEKRLSTSLLHSKHKFFARTRRQPVFRQLGEQGIENSEYREHDWWDLVGNIMSQFKRGEASICHI